ncbi:MAG: cytochrome c3 family protein [Robiginitomaculum sp.]|nr:cytochrome c3 family protein [Robiginitomaculum sp.]
MTITVRNLKRRPGGRESIRERTYETDEISIGRETDNDLQLLDLRIALKHARLKRTSDGMASLEMLGGHTANIDGRLKSRANYLKPGTLIRIGVYELLIEEPSSPDDLTVRLEQVEIVESAITSADENKVFGLKRALPGKRIMAWVFSIAVIGFFLALPIWAAKNKDSAAVKALPIQADLSWNSGEISLMHANLKNDCSTCHTKAFVPVKDKACVECHEKLGDHADIKDLRASKPKLSGFEANLNKVSEMFLRPAERCASCHVEHNSREKIMPASQKLCADCHSNLDKTVPHTMLLNVSDFGSDHPEFRPSIITLPDFNEPKYTRISLSENPKGFSGLKFPHKMHLDRGGSVAKMAGEIGGKFSIVEDSARIGSGVDCADCHRPEAGGALFDPVNMQQDCAVCHDLAFEADDGYTRTLRHGEPDEVIASMRDYYQAQALGNIRDAEMNSRTRRRPGKAASLRDLNRRELAFKQADQRTASKVNAIFSEGGACFDCHEIDRPANITSLDFAIRPISVNGQFYPKSPFDHASHEIGNLTCETCHTARTSESSSDVLLPRIKICQDCHIGIDSYAKGGEMAQGTMPSNCLTCHTYHNGPHAGIMGGKSLGNSTQ